MTNQRIRSSAELGFEPKFSFLTRLAKFETGLGDAEAESDLGGETRARVQRTVRTEKTKKTGSGLKQKKIKTSGDLNFGSLSGCRRRCNEKFERKSRVR